MDDGHTVPGIILFLVFIVINIIFYGFASAIQNINEGKLEDEAQQGNERAEKILKIINSPVNFISAMQIITNLLSMMTGAFILGGTAQIIEMKFISKIPVLSAEAFPVAGGILATILLIAVLVCFGIIIPKRCAAKNPERWAYRMYNLVMFLSIPLLPFIWITTGIAGMILNLIDIDLNIQDENVTEEDIMSMVNEGHEQGVLEASEAEMITNIFELDDKQAGDIMTHRKNIVAIDAESTLNEAISFILNEGNNSRYPVYQNDIDDIIGILHMKDAVMFREKSDCGEKKICEIPELLREAHFIPETRNIKALFREMQSGKIHMEIVIDEYGQTAGIVTMEDVLEEIVGNIQDEYDVEEDYIEKKDDKTFLLSGMTPLDEAADELNVEFSEEDYDNYDTINGLLISKLGHIPQEDEQASVDYMGYHFQILRMENKIIEKVRATKLEDEQNADTE